MVNEFILLEIELGIYDYVLPTSEKQITKMPFYSIAPISECWIKLPKYNIHKKLSRLSYPKAVLLDCNCCNLKFVLYNVFDMVLLTEEPLGFSLFGFFSL